MGSKTGVNISRVDFSEPQGGKGPCDRKAATIKARVRWYLNEGNNVTTVREFRDAIMSSGGVPGVRVAMFDAGNLCDPHVKWEGISRENYFAYSNRKVTAWEAYGLGVGRVKQQSDLQG